MRPSWRLTLLLVLALPQICLAWGGEAHQLIALIAEDQLTPAAKAGIKELIGDANVSDAEIASWADEVRRERRETGPWHYVNIPVTADRFDRGRDGNGRDNIIDALETQSKILADKAQPKEKRVEALKWVVHLAGDLHQPLHAADRDDKGGNSRLVFHPARREAVSLHFAWDTLIARDMMAGRRVTQVAKTMGSAIGVIERKQWAQGTPEAWANECHKVAVEKAYKGVPADGPPPRLERQYLDAARAATAEQIKRAGVRLATMLNASLK